MTGTGTGFEFDFFTHLWLLKRLRLRYAAYNPIPGFDRIYFHNDHQPKENIMQNKFVMAVIAVVFISFASFATAADKVVLIVSHEVADFAAWKKVYDQDKVNRDKAGMKERYLVRDVEKPNIVTIVFQAGSVDKVKAFIANPALKEAMDKAGVMGAPDIKIGTTAKVGGKK